MAPVPYLRSLKPVLRRLVFPALAVLCAVLASCLERSNPFDPINSRPTAVIDILKQDRPALVALTSAESTFTAFLKGLLAEFSKDSAANGEVAKGNALHRQGNLAAAAWNLDLAAYNQAQTIKDSLRLKIESVPLDPYKSYGPYAGFLENRAGLQNLTVTVKTHFTLVNAGNFPLVVYNAAFVDSVFQPFVRDSIGYAGFKARIDSANAAVADSNAVVEAYKQELVAVNQRVRKYNDSILFVKRVQNVIVLTRSDSLLAGVAVAKAGDSLFLGAGTFNVDLRFNNAGTPDSPIVVTGFPGRLTIIRPSLSGAGSRNSMVLGPGKKYIRFENLVFRGGVEGNVKLEGGAEEITFRNCVFDSSAGAGLEAYDSKFRMINCEIKANGDVGVKLGGAATEIGEFEFNNVLIARNAKAGLQSTSQRLNILKCTIADNGGDGIRIVSPLQKVSIYNSLITRNLGYGIEREATSINQDKLDVWETDLYGNEAGNWFLPKMDSTITAKLFSDNYSEVPVFSNAPGFEYNPEPGSFLDIQEKRDPPLLIGYRRPVP